MAFCLRYVFSLQELPPELLPMSENLTEEREIHLSSVGIRQRSLKMWFCNVIIALRSVRWPHSQPVFTTFHADLSHYRIGNVQKRTAARSLPPQATAKSCSVTILGCSVRLGEPLSHYRKEVRCCSATSRENIMQITAFSWGHLTLKSALVALQHFAAAGEGCLRGAVRF